MEAKIKPIKPNLTSKGYCCPICNNYYHEWILPVYNHMQWEHGEKTLRISKERMKKQHENKHNELYNVKYETKKDDKQCCNKPILVLLNKNIPLQKKALEVGFNIICENCKELGI